MAETSERGSRTGTAADHRSRSGFDIRVFPLVQQRPAQTMWQLPVEGRVEIVGVRDRANKLHHISDFAAISALEALTSEAYEHPDPDLKAGEFATCNAARVVRVGGSLSGDPCDPPVCTALVWREPADRGDGAREELELSGVTSREQAERLARLKSDADTPGAQSSVFPNGYRFRRLICPHPDSPSGAYFRLSRHAAWGNGIRCETPDGVALRHTLEDNTLWVRMPILTEDESLAFFVYYDREPNHLVLAKVESTPGVEAAPSMMAWDYQPVWAIEKCAGSSAISGPDGGVALASGDALPEGVEVAAEGGGVWLDLNKDDDDSQYDKFSPTAARLIAAALVRAADKAEEQASKANSSTTVTPPVGDPSLYYGMKIGDRTIVPYTPSGDPNRRANPSTEAENFPLGVDVQADGLHVQGGEIVPLEPKPVEAGHAFPGTLAACGWKPMESAPPDGRHVMLLLVRRPRIIRDTPRDFHLWADDAAVGRFADGRWLALRQAPSWRARTSFAADSADLIEEPVQPLAWQESPPGMVVTDLGSGTFTVVVSVDCRARDEVAAKPAEPEETPRTKPVMLGYCSGVEEMKVDPAALVYVRHEGPINALDQPAPAEPEARPTPEPDVPAWLAESDHPLYGRGT